MMYTPTGKIAVTAVKNRPGLYSADGFVQITDQTANSAFCGAYAPDGSLNVTILVSEAVRTGMYAPNGSLNIVSGAGRWFYSPCGAMNVSIG